ncbi:MAG: hypothetical protein ACFFDN_26790 [Candidatus Hodarchaeota archaeon]
MKKKFSILVGFFFLILLVFPAIIVNSNNINEKHYKEDSVATLKTSALKPGFSYVMNLNANYDWIEINQTGILMKTVSTADDWFQSINLTAEDGWEFPFYGREYTNISVCSNGWMTCTYEGDPTAYDFSGVPGRNFDYVPQDCSIYPNHNDSILLYATDLEPDYKGNIYYEFRGTPSNRCLVIEFDRVAEIFTDKNQTFQAILYKNGEIKIQYKKTTDTAGFNYEQIVAGLDHGDLKDYNNVTYDFWHGIEEKAIYFSLYRAPPGLPPPDDDDDDDDDDDEAYLTLLIVLIVVFVSIGAGVAVIYILIKKGIIGSSR